VFWEGGREREVGVGLERERRRTFVFANVFLSNSQWVLNMFLIASPLHMTLNV
jgi:hypothetical protein